MVAATEKTDTLIYDIDLTLPIAIIMGSEDQGIAFVANLQLMSSNVTTPCAYRLHNVLGRLIIGNGIASFDNSVANWHKTGYFYKLLIIKSTI